MIPTVAEETAERAELRLDEMTPRQIVKELDKYIVGQQKAKRSVALALRNRIRRQKLPVEMAAEIQPQNIILIGSTGVGKTEIARRLARLTNAPFLKVEASKFTEVGYVGRDVESIVRDLADVAAEMVRQEKVSQIEEKAEKQAEERLLKILLGGRKGRRKVKSSKTGKSGLVDGSDETGQRVEKLRKDLREGKLNRTVVELDVTERIFSPLDFVPPGPEDFDLPLKDFVAGLLGNRTHKREMSVEEALDYLIVEEESKLVDMDLAAREAMERVEQSGIVFIDELDKIAGRESGTGPEVSREGVQRDILPIIEGTTVSTRYGMVRTDHILFIGAGAFHVAKPADLIPELQGRFPIRVEMEQLTMDDFVAILTRPKNALIKQYTALLATEGIKLIFTRGAIEKISHYAVLVNDTNQNIGARRLYTIMETLLEEVSFEAPELAGKELVIDVAYVRRRLADITKDADLSRYIL